GMARPQPGPAAGAAQGAADHRLAARGRTNDRLAADRVAAVGGAGIRDSGFGIRDSGFGIREMLLPLPPFEKGYGGSALAFAFAFAESQIPNPRHQKLATETAPTAPAPRPSPRIHVAPRRAPPGAIPARTGFCGAGRVECRAAGAPPARPVAARQRISINIPTLPASRASGCTPCNGVCRESSNNWTPSPTNRSSPATTVTRP